MLKIKWTQTFSIIVYNEKWTWWIQKNLIIVFHCKCNFWNFYQNSSILGSISNNGSKTNESDRCIDYSVRVGYQASRNNMQEYKIYAIVIQMFNQIFVNNLQPTFDDNPWPTKLKNHKPIYYTKQNIYWGRTQHANIVETSHKKWPKNESDPNDDEYELLILKYDANQDKLV